MNATAPDGGRRRTVIGADADAAGATAERYYRSWTDETDTLRRQEKLAFRLAEYDEQTANRLKRLDWAEHHTGWDDDYRLRDGRCGAWTADADGGTPRELRRAGAPIPPIEALGLVAELRPWSPAIGRTCPVCGADRICSDRDLVAYPGADDLTALDLCRRSDAITHVCVWCRRLFENQAKTAGHGGRG